MTDRISRINAVINYLGVTKNNLALNSGIGPSNFNKMLSGEQSITDKTLHKISEAYPNINIDWLKTGAGEMVNPSVSITQTGDNSILQSGHAGHDLNQTNNSEKLLSEFIEGLKYQNIVTERAMAQTESAMNQTDRAMAQTDKALDEISEQRKLVDRLISIIEKK